MSAFSKVSIKTPGSKESKEIKDDYVEVKEPGASTSIIRGLGKPLVQKLGKKGGKKGRRSGSSTSVSLPPATLATIKVRHVFTYICTSAASVGVTVLEFTGSLGGVCTVVNSTIQHWASSWRIHKLTVWPTASTTSLYQNYVDWSSDMATFYPDYSKSKVLPAGITDTSPMVYTPPKGCLARSWVTPGQSITITKNVFTLNLQAGTVLHVDCEFTLGNVYSTTTTTVGTTGFTTAVLGNFYYISLDGRASNKVQHSDGLPTTT